ncbi:MAG: HD domain-containing phosphohydrolase [Pirellulales bacterium]
MKTMTDQNTILVIDDERPIRDLIARWLRSEGFRALEADSAASGWAELQTNEVDLVTCDIRMPGESGLELLSRIQGSYSDTAVLMLTASADTKTAIQSLTSGAYGYLVKPVEREELLFQVKRGLERRRLVIENREYTQKLESRVRKQTEAIRHAHEETIHRLLNAAMLRDEETGAHIRRTGLYSELFAEVLGWPAEEIDTIRLAAPMHDVGKIGIPDAILCKPGKLSDAEFDVMKTHTLIGAEILGGSDWPVLKLAHEIALYHHERWDGTGYPNRVRGEAIPLSARILALVDVYDALTHDRVYRAALPEEEAIDLMIKGRGTHFDPYLFGVFLTLVPELRRISLVNPDLAEDKTRPFLTSEACAIPHAVEMS